MSSSSLACLLALLAAVNPTNANNATDAPQQRLLDASLSPGCPTSCSSFHAGASINSTMVCTYAKSGVGYLSETLNQGLACYPAYNCREDWNVCLQWVKNTTHAETPPVTIPTTSPLSNLSDTSLLLVACQEITALQAGGSSGTVPPSGGWKPTSLGWRKGSGNIGCGWGSTFSNVDPASSFSLADFGRVVKNGISDPVQCCMEAMKYEGVDMAHGGAAIRFDVYNGQCRIDRELMMRGNLDTSGGRPLNTLDHCGAAQDFSRSRSHGRDCGRPGGHGAHPGRCGWIRVDQKEKGACVLAAMVITLAHDLSKLRMGAKLDDQLIPDPRTRLLFAYVCT